jgi:excisionase family DNA binding protein
MRNIPASRRRVVRRAPVMAMSMATSRLPGPPIEADLLDLAEVAQRLNVSRTTIWRLAKRGDIRTVHIGGRTLVPRTELQRLIGEGSGATR